MTDKEKRKRALELFREMKGVVPEKQRAEKAKQYLKRFTDMPTGLSEAELDDKAVKFKKKADVIDTKPKVIKEISGKELKGKISKFRALRKLAGKAGKALPMVGSLVGPAMAGYAALRGDKAQASEHLKDSIPLVGSSSDLGPSKGTLEAKLESGERLSNKEQALLNKKAALKKLKN